jgi:general secretion pathway protein N
MPFFHRPLKRSPRPRPEGATKLWNRMSSSLLVLPGRSGNDHREAQARRVRRWAVSGAVCGSLVAAVVWAPAQWLAAAVASASEGRFQLADAQGSLWSGDAVLLLTAGPGAREASALPGRLGWRIAPTGAGLKVVLQHACCLNGEVGLTLSVGLGRWSARLDPAQPNPGAADAAAAAAWIGQWPAALLMGLGTPWNTLQPGGLLRLSGQNLSVEGARGRLALNGQVDVELQGFSR